MLKYRYKSIGEDGRYVKGVISAQNQSDLAVILKSSKLELIDFKIVNSKNISFFSSIKTKDLITLFVHLEQLDRASVPIAEAIEDIKETADSIKIRNLMQEIYESIKNGNLFSESLAKHPEIFSSVYVGLIASGEKTGHLSQSFASIIEDLKWSLNLKRKAKQAVMGPLFALTVMFISVGVMMGIVVPKVTGFLRMQDIAMPATTIALIWFSNFIQNYWFILILFIPISYITLKILYKNPDLSIKLDAAKLKIPIIGSIITKIDSAKFCQFFSMTFKSGLGVIECLDSAGSIIKNRAIRKAIGDIKKQVSDGRSLAKSIESTQYFPSLVVRMFKVGEDSGNMEESLRNIKFFYDQEINDSIDRLVSLIQPALTLFMGGMIAWVTVAVFGPIYGTFAKIK